MTKKRVSLKDKGPETLGLGEKKGKGIDVLFGTSATTHSNIDRPKTEVTNMTAQNKDALTNPTRKIATPPPPSVESLPVNEADNSLDSFVLETDDNLGLPVAMELPPATVAPVNVRAREIDELGLPVAMDAPPIDLTRPVSLPIETTPTMSGLPNPVEDNDLSDLAGEEDLAGLMDETEVPTLATMVEPPASFVTYTPSPPLIPTPVAPPPPPQIEGFGGMVTDVIAKIRDLLPPDHLYDAGVLQLTERTKAEKDDQISEKVGRYIGKERREALDREIMQLYWVVTEELSDNNEDISFALKALSEAHDIVLEDIRQYDEAIYRLAIVKTMLTRRRNLKRWSYTWGLFIFFYALAWLAFFVTALIFTGNINNLIQNLAGSSGGLIAASTAWYSALTGGVGGIVGILYSLYWRVAIKQNFDRQYIMYYLVQPIMGFMLGAITHLIVTAGFLVVNASGATSQITIIIQMVIGFIAGFRQQTVYEVIDRIVQKIAPTEPDKSPTSTAPEQ